MVGTGFLALFKETFTKFRIVTTIMTVKFNRHKSRLVEVGSLVSVHSS